MEKKFSNSENIRKNENFEKWIAWGTIDATLSSNIWEKLWYFCLPLGMFVHMYLCLYFFFVFHVFDVFCLHIFCLCCLFVFSIFVCVCLTVGLCFSVMLWLFFAFYSIQLYMLLYVKNKWGFNLILVYLFTNNAFYKIDNVTYKYLLVVSIA